MYCSILIGILEAHTSIIVMSMWMGVTDSRFEHLPLCFKFDARIYMFANAYTRGAELDTLLREAVM